MRLCGRNTNVSYLDLQEKFHSSKKNRKVRALAVLLQIGEIKVSYIFLRKAYSFFCDDVTEDFRAVNH